MRQIVLDTETTGINPNDGHRVIEIGCLEVTNRRITTFSFHQYINPERESDPGALAVHGLKQEFLATKPLFSEIVDEFLAFVNGAQLIIHNAPFDVSFLNHELGLLNKKKYSRITEYCSIIDTLSMAKRLHPGQRNNLDALCKRYNVNNSHRELHGALLDAQLLAKVYLAMTGGQTTLFSDEPKEANSSADQLIALSSSTTNQPLPIIMATEEENASHINYLSALAKSNKKCRWEMGPSS